MLPMTTFSRLSRTQAVAVLSAMGVFAALFVGIATARSVGSPRRGGPGDVALYRAEAERIRGGEGYYDAAAAELRARGYPTRSVFNWRTPLPMWLDGKLPRPAAKVLLCGLALVLLLSTLAFVQQQAGTLTGVVAGLLMTGAVMPCVLGDLYVMPVVWAGVLIGLSLTSHGLGHTRWSVAAGVSALLVRELAAVYCLTMLAVACWQRRWREALGWLSGMAAYAVFFAVHLTAVLPRISAGDVAHADGWVQFGGAAFLIGVAQMNAYLLVLPAWVAGLYLIAVLSGVAAWPTPTSLRVGMTIAAYVVVFGIVGQPFNQYWGSLLAPTFCLGAAWFPAAVTALWRRAVERSDLVSAAEIS